LNPRTKRPERSVRETPDSAKLRFPSRILITGVLVLLTAAGSSYLMARSRGVDCDTLAPLTVLATLAAFLISVCFRQMSRYPGRRGRWFLVTCLVVAGATLFTDFRYVRRNRGFCSELRRQMQSPPISP
jgi:uncharacterized membrane protein YfcA